MQGVLPYAKYSPSEAVTAFSSAESVEWYCENQFAVFPGRVLGFITFGTLPTESQAVSPSSVVWRPADLEGGLGICREIPVPLETPESPDCFPWFPRPVRGEFKTNVEHHLFLRTSADEAFTYVGPADFGGLGDGRGNRQANFKLTTKL